MMVDRLAANPLVLQLPWGTEADLHGVIDLVQFNAHYWEGDMGEDWMDTDIPEEYLEAATKARHDLFEKLAEHDEALMEKFVLEEEPTIDELHKAIRAMTLAGARRPGALRFGVQEQGRAARARRGRPLPAEPARRAARSRATGR